MISPNRTRPRLQAGLLVGAADVIDDLRKMKLVKAAELLEESGHETLTPYGFTDRRASDGLSQ